MIIVKEAEDLLFASVKSHVFALNKIKQKLLSLQLLFLNPLNKSKFLNFLI